MADTNHEAKLQQLEKEKNRLLRKLKRYETQLHQLDKMASANEKMLSYY
jgi:hypothetical protein